MTPRQQKEALALVRWYASGQCTIGNDNRCQYAMVDHNRWHDRARLFLKLTAPKPARRKKA